MAKAPTQGGRETAGMSRYDSMLLEATEKGDETLETGRYVVTYNTEATDETKQAVRRKA